MLAALLLLGLLPLAVIPLLEGLRASQTATRKGSRKAADYVPDLVKSSGIGSIGVPNFTAGFYMHSEISNLGGPALI